MKRFLLGLIILITIDLKAQEVFLNEIRANDAGTDDSEFIELIGPAGTDISGWQIEHINGNGGALIFSFTFPQGAVIPDDGITDLNGQSIGFIVAKRSGHTVVNYDYEWGTTSLQNGPDGIILYNHAGVRQQALTWNGLGDLSGGEPPWRNIGSDQNDDNSLSAPDSLFEIDQKPWEYVSPTPGMLNTNQTIGDITLPVELSSFRTIAGDKIVKLIWITQAEMDNQGFIIERSYKKDSGYIQIATYQSLESLRGAGNSSEKRHYTFTDNAVFNGLTYWYRLIDVSVDGIHTCHDPLSATPQAPEDPPETVDPEPDPIQPERFQLSQNMPNPFNPETMISYFIPHPNYIDLSIYNLLGQRIRTLVTGYQASGTHRVAWNGENNSGGPVSGGIYIYSLRYANQTISRKMVLLR